MLSRVIEQSHNGTEVETIEVTIPPSLRTHLRSSSYSEIRTR
ncbi:MAG: hypothetical protein ACN4GG_08330 [Akkermansiaceae bacterium]